MLYARARIHRLIIALVVLSLFSFLPLLAQFGAAQAAEAVLVQGAPAAPARPVGAAPRQEEPGAITGVVANPEEPLEGIRVLACQWVHGQCSDGMAMFWKTWTDFEGIYRLENVPPGDYRVLFHDPNQNYLDQYYQGALTSDLATLVEVRAAQTTALESATLLRAGQILGTVTNSTPEPIEGINVTACLNYSEAAGCEQLLDADTDSTGLFDIVGVSPGTWRLMFQDWSGNYAVEYYNDQQSWSTATPFAVATSEIVTEKDALLTRGGSISGMITTADNTVIADAWARACFWDDESCIDNQHSVHVESDGAYSIRGLADGDWRLEFFVNSGDYLAQYYHNSTNREDAARITITNHAALTGYDAVLARAGRISGIVTGAGSGTLANVGVFACRWEGETCTHVFSTSTGNDGVYSIGRLLEGDWRLYFAASGDSYLGEYLGGDGFKDATSFLVGAVKEYTGANAELAKAGHISGVITGAGAGQLNSIYVEACHWENSQCSDSTSTNPGSDGTYTLGGLRAGNWRLRFYDVSGNYLEEYYADATSWASAGDIPVAAGANVTGIDAVLEKAGSISGTVTEAGAGALQSVHVEACFWDGLTCTIGLGIDTNENGVYFLGGLTPGAWRIRFSDYIGAYIVQYYGNAAATGWDGAQTINVDSVTPVTGIDAALIKAATIVGKVTNGAGVGVELVSIDHWRWDGDAWRYEGYGLTDQNGNYVLGGLAPGAHRLYFFDNNQMYLSKYYDDKTIESEATPINLVAGDTFTANAVLTRGGSISGAVTDSALHGLPNIYVEVCRWDETAMGCTESRLAATDSNGQYEIGRLAAGNWRLRFYDASGTYFEEYYVDAPSWEAAADIPVAAEATVTGKDAVLERASRIQGKVTNAENTALTSIQVIACRWDEMWCTESRWASTDVDGNYDIGGLTAGNWRLRFYDGSGTYFEEYYNDAPSWDSGTDIPVAAGATVTGKDAVLERASHIQGKVTNAENAALANINVTACRWDEITGLCVDLRSAGTDVDGNYNIGGLFAGNWRLYFNDWNGNYLEEYYVDATSWTSAVDIPVATGTTISGKDAILKRASRIQGRVTNVENAALTSIQVIACRWDETMMWCTESRSDNTDVNGNYDIGGLTAGNWRLRFYDANGSYIEEYYNDAPSWTSAVDVPVAAEATVTGKDAVLERASRIQGKVTDAENGAIANIYVVACRWTGGMCAETQGATTDVDGKYDLGGLRAGNWRLHFNDWSGNYIEEYYVDATSWEAAAEIPVAAGVTVAGKDAVLERTSRIQGKVTNAENAALANIDVTACRWDGTTELCVDWRSAGTDVNGNYDIGGLTAGNWRLGFYDANGNYFEEYYNDAPSWASAVDIPIAAGVTVSGKNAILERASLIQGKVTNAENAALANINVMACRWDELTGLCVDLRSAITGVDGIYSIGGLTAGNWRLHFNDWSGSYLDEYYDGATSWTNAVDIPVAAATTVTGKDAVLERPSRIQGKVTNAENAALANIDVTACRWDETMMGCTESRWAGTDVDGNYSFDGLRTGNWRLNFYDATGTYIEEYYNDAASWETATPIEVLGGATVTVPDVVLVILVNTPTPTPVTPTPETPTPETPTPVTPTPETPTPVTPIQETPTPEPPTPEPPTPVPPTPVPPTPVPPTPVPPTPVPPTPATPAPGTPTPVPLATMTVEPSQPTNATFGGSAGQTISVQVPAGVVTSTTTLQFDQLPTPPPASPNFQMGSFNLQIQAVQNGVPLESFAFAQPIQVVITYTDADVAGMDENELELLYFDPKSLTWSTQGITVVSRDPAANQIVVTISHLTTFSLGIDSPHIYLPAVIRQ